jgi:hypothetical protein
MDEIKTRVKPSPPLPVTAASAIAAAGDQLPYLRADTIESIMVSAGQVLEPAEVLRRAYAAADRGRALLTPRVAAELDGLAGTLAAELPPAEGARVGHYLLGVRGRAVAVPYQDKEAVWLMARAARRLPMERLTVLQDVFAEAITLSRSQPASTGGAPAAPASDAPAAAPAPAAAAAPTVTEAGK